MKRHQRTRQKGYKTPENTKYVGRPTKFGNPFRLTKDGKIECYSRFRTVFSKWILFLEYELYTIQDVVGLYERWLKGEFLNKYPFLPIPPTEEEIKELEGKNLSCFCNLNQPCHVDIILKQFEK